MAREITKSTFNEPVVFPSMVTGNREEDYWLNSAHLDRGFKEYCEELGMDISLLIGLKILDIGSGRADRFGYEARKLGLDVTSSNPNWGDPKYVQDLQKKHYGWSLGERRLPFSSQSDEWQNYEGVFDVVLALNSISLYLPGTESVYRRTYANIHRLLAPNGIAIISPFLPGIMKQPKFHEVLTQTVPNHFFLDEVLHRLIIEKN